MGGRVLGICVGVPYVGVVNSGAGSVLRRRAGLSIEGSPLEKGGGWAGATGWKPRLLLSAAKEPPSDPPSEPPLLVEVGLGGP